jgi:hypothetical protein
LVTSTKRNEFTVLALKLELKGAPIVGCVLKVTVASLQGEVTRAKSNPPAVATLFT